MFHLSSPSLKTMKMTRKMKNRKPKSSKSHSCSLSLSFSNVRGLRTNFPFVESLLHTSSPHVLALCETNLDSTVSSKDLNVDGYLPLFRKDSGTYMHGLAIYIQKDLPASRMQCLVSATDDSYMCF